LVAASQLVWLILNQAAFGARLNRLHCKYRQAAFSNCKPTSISLYSSFHSGAVSRLKNTVGVPRLLRAYAALDGGEHLLFAGRLP